MQLRAVLLLLVLHALQVIAAPSRLDHKQNWRQDILYRLKNQDYTNEAPLFGVLTQPHGLKHSKYKSSQSISGPLVSWIESAGGRVVPIPYNAPNEELDSIFEKINGLILPVRHIDTVV